MSLHAELLVRVLTDGAIHFVRPDLEGEGQCGRRAGLDELRLPLDALPFDLESVWDAPALVTVKETGPAAIVASDSSTFHSESLAVTAAGVPGARCAAVVASATQASKTKATLRDGTASVVLMAIFLLRVCDNSFSRRQRPHAPSAYSFGNNPAARGVLTRWRTAHPEDRLESSELERFEAVVLPHLDAAYTLARYLTRSDHDAQDVVQDASLRAFQHFGTFRGGGSAEGRAWLLPIVRNTADSWQRRHHA